MPPLKIPLQKIPTTLLPFQCSQNAVVLLADRSDGVEMQLQQEKSCKILTDLNR